MNYFAQALNSEEANRFIHQSRTKPLPSCPSLQQTRLFTDVFTFASSMQRTLSLDPSLDPSACVSCEDQMILDDRLSASYCTNQHFSFMPFTPYNVPCNSPNAHIIRHNDRHCLPQGVDDQVINEDAGMFFEDRELVAQMLSSADPSSSSQRSVALGGSGDYPMSPNDARHQTTYEYSFGVTSNCCHSSTYTDSPVTPPNQIHIPTSSSPIQCPAQQLYHPQPRYFDPMFRFLEEPPSGPIHYITPLPPLIEDDCAAHYSMSDDGDMLRNGNERPRVHTGLGIYQLDTVSFKNRRAPVASPERRSSKRGREEDEEYDEGRYKRYRTQ